jgi:hypothetical protein
VANYASGKGKTGIIKNDNRVTFVFPEPILNKNSIHSEPDTLQMRGVWHVC